MSALWMVAASLLFAGMGVCVKLGSTQFSAAELVVARGAVATALLGAYMLAFRLPAATPHWPTHLWRGLSGFVSLVAYFMAIGMIPLATAVTLNYTSPLFLAVLLVVWVREPVKPGLFYALGTGFAGIVLLLQPTLASEQWLGAVLGVGSGAISSIAYFNVRRLGELGEPEWRTVFYFSLMTTVGGLPWLIAGGYPHAVDPRGWLLLLGIGSFGAGAQLCMTAAYKRGATLTTANLAYSTVIFSSLFGVLLWDERLPLAGWLGMALVVASGAMATVLAGKRGRSVRG